MLHFPDYEPERGADPVLVCVLSYKVIRAPRKARATDMSQFDLRKAFGCIFHEFLENGMKKTMQNDYLVWWVRRRCSESIDDYVHVNLEGTTQ